MYAAVGEPFDSSRGAGPAQGLSEESWQNGYCTGLENRRPQGLGGSNPSLSAANADFILLLRIDKLTIQGLYLIFR